TSCVMISRNRSAPTAAAISIECTTSANNTVACLYSAALADAASGDPHSSQNLALTRDAVPHAAHPLTALSWHPYRARLATRRNSARHPPPDELRQHAHHCRRGPQRPRDPNRPAALGQRTRRRRGHLR